MGRMDGWTNGRMDEWTNEWVYEGYQFRMVREYVSKGGYGILGIG